MFWRVNLLIYRVMKRWWKYSVDTVNEDEYEYLVMDDFEDIKQFHRAEIGTKNHKDRRKMLRKRMNFYVRHGFFDLAEDIDTAFWTMERKT